MTWWTASTAGIFSYKEWKSHNIDEELHSVLEIKTEPVAWLRQTQSEVLVPTLTLARAVELSGRRAAVADCTN